MKKLILISLCLITITARAQTKVAEISTPGRWLVYETGKVFQIDSLDNAVTLLTKAGEENCSAWIVQVDNGMLCSVWVTSNGVQFRQSIVKYSETILDNRKKTRLHGSNK
jgi:hypothetical protein